MVPISTILFIQTFYSNKRLNRINKRIHVVPIGVTEENLSETIFKTIP